jgi:dihydropteroate synthase
VNDDLSAIRSQRGVALMGIVNTTPDSFYDGGRHDAPEAARRHVDALLAAGADVLDIGGESTRPGATPVPAREQWHRIEPALDYALERGALVSVDTTQPDTAELALSRGAHIINDVSCLSEPELARVVARHGAVLLLMHSRGGMQDMSGFSAYPDRGYGDVVADVRTEWARARDVAVAQGMAPDAVWFDPGLGFHKNARHSFELLSRLNELSDLAAPIVVGASRKSFLAAGDGSAPEERLGGTIAACLHAVSRGAAMLRVHDVHAVAQALRVARTLQAPAQRPTPERRLDA